MRPKSSPSSGVTSRQLDFRAPSDDAWYAVRVRTEVEGSRGSRGRGRGGRGRGRGRVISTLRLKLMYCDFAERFDEYYSSDHFADLTEVEEFSDRFRSPAIQLQDRDCAKVTEGMIVCVSHSFAESDIRFYDAVVESVHYSDHKFLEGEYECACKYDVLWQHGPLAGKKTIVTVGNVCLLPCQNSIIDPILDRFLEISRQRFAASTPVQGHAHQTFGNVPELSAANNESAHADDMMKNQDNQHLSEKGVAASVSGESSEIITSVKEEPKEYENENRKRSWDAFLELQ